MVRKHRHRLASMVPYVIPEPNSPDRAAFEALLNQAVPKAMADKVAKKAWRKVVALTSAQVTNGAGLPADKSLREFHWEYNSRLHKGGLQAMPTSFNGLEAFFQFIPQIACFRLLSEIDHMFSFPNLIDYITSEAPILDMPDLLESMPNGIVLNYSNSSDPGDLLFSGYKGQEFGVESFSMVRHGPEVTVFLVAGQVADLSNESKRIFNDLQFGRSRRPYLEKRDTPTEAIPIESQSAELWRVLAIARFDIEERTEDARYIFQDVGDQYIALTDDMNAFRTMTGEFASDIDEDTMNSICAHIDEFNILFELCTTGLYLPTYFEENGSEVLVERMETDYLSEVKKAPKHLRRLIPSSERIAFRNVHIIDPPEELMDVPDRTIAIPDLRVESSGYWKPLGDGKIGADRSGRPIKDRTWVKKRLTWLERDQPRGTIYSTTSILPEGNDPGWLYVVRSAIHPPNVFKVGLTRRTPDERAAELSAHSNSPDRFLVVNEWPVGDCSKVERAAHEALADMRINPQREFFEIPLRELVSIINEIVDRESEL